MQPETSRWAVAVLAVACALAALAMAAALLHHPQAAASYTPPPFDPAAVTGTPAAPEGYGTVDAPAYTVALCGAPAVQEGAAQLWFTNPGQNTVWLKVRIYTPDGILLGESGLLKPGQYVQAVALSPVPDAGTSIVLKVMAYEPDTYHSAGAVTLNTALAD